MGTVKASGITAHASGTPEHLSGMGLFAAELKAQRAKQGWTQLELAAKIGYSNSYVSDIERGEKLPSSDFTQRLDEGFDTPGTFERLLEIAKRTLYPSWFAPVIPYEEKALRINGWELGSLPGLAQTEDYARGLIRSVKHSAPDDEVERLVIGRTERQNILTRGNPPKLSFVIDESTLRRVVVGPEVMAQQIDKLIEVTCIPGCIIQVLTHAGGWGIGTPGPIAIYEFEPGQPMVGYAECYHGGRLIEDLGEVSEILTDLTMIRMSALSPRESVEFMRRIRGEYNERVA
jgi:transcriptional regulator with XRE-family HTH domain